MTELTRQIHRLEMSHSLMNGANIILHYLAEENDEKMECLERENAALRKLIQDEMWPFMQCYMSESFREQLVICLKTLGVKVD